MTDLLSALAVLAATYCAGGLHMLARVRKESHRWHAWAHRLVLDDVDVDEVST